MARLSVRLDSGQLFAYEMKIIIRAINRTPQEYLLVFYILDYRYYVFPPIFLCVMGVVVDLTVVFIFFEFFFAYVAEFLFLSAFFHS